MVPVDNPAYPNWSEPHQSGHRACRHRSRLAERCLSESLMCRALRFRCHCYCKSKTDINNSRIYSCDPHAEDWRWLHAMVVFASSGMACGDYGTMFPLNWPSTSSNYCFSQGTQCSKDHHHEVLDLHYGEGQPLEISIFAYMLVQDLGEQSSLRRYMSRLLIENCLIKWKDCNGDPSVCLWPSQISMVALITRCKGFTKHLAKATLTDID